MPTPRRRRIALGLLGLLALLGSLLEAPRPAGATVLPVSNCNDTTPFPPGMGGELRTLVLAAAPGDTVTIPACTITVALGNGPILVPGSMTIQGTGAGQTIIQAGGAFPIFLLTTPGTAVTISGVTLQNSGVGAVALTGTTLTVTDSTLTGHSGGPAIEGIGSTALTVRNSTVSGNAAGGIVATAGTLTVAGTTVSNTSGAPGILIVGTTSSATVTDSTVSGNPAGGIVATAGTLTVARTRIIGNIDPGGPGGLLSTGVGTTTHVTDSTISGNSSSGFGGGLFVGSGTLTMSNSTIANNTALGGGGIFGVSAALTLSNVTVTGNTATAPAGVGGGIAVASGSLTLTNGTVTGNTASGGGSIGGGLYNTGATVTVRNTIVAGNTASTGADCGGPTAITSAGHNIDGGNTCALSQPGDQSNTDPMLGPLQNNGGPTLTRAALGGSPAIDAGDNAGCPGTDQRGVPRPLDTETAGVAVCDIGAVEVETLGFIQAGLALNTATVGPGTLLQGTVTVTNEGGARPLSVYVVFALPAAVGPSVGCPSGDAVVFLTGSGATLTCVSSGVQTFAPFLTNVSLSGGLATPVSAPLFSFVWPAGAPPGPYVVGLVFTPVGAFSDGRVDPTADINVATAGFSATP